MTLLHVALKIVSSGEFLLAHLTLSSLSTGSSLRVMDQVVSIQLLVLREALVANVAL